MNDDEFLKQLLNTWKVDPEIPARFQSGVWQRIATRDSEREASLWESFNNWIVDKVGRPAQAASVVMAGLILGATAAYLQAQDSNARHWRQLETRYIQSINPLTHIHEA